MKAVAGVARIGLFRLPEVRVQAPEPDIDYRE